MGIRDLPAFLAGREPARELVRGFIRAKVRGQQRGPAAVILWRLFFASLATAVTIGLASLGQFFATAPEWISLTLEPLSLLLLPGFAVALMTAGLHDLDPSIIVQASIIFYLIFFYVWLTWQSRRKAR